MIVADDTVYSEADHVPILENPFVKVRIDSKDHESIKISNISEWDSDITANKWNDELGRPMYGLNVSNSATEINFTKPHIFPKSGLYSIQVLCYFGPSQNGTLQLYDGTTAIEDPTSLYDKNEHYSWIKYHPTHYNSGAHTLKLRLHGTGKIIMVMVIPITRYEGDNLDNNYDNNLILDLLNFTFTENSVNEPNTFSLNCVMKDHYYADDPTWGLTYFRLNDPITIWVGPDEEIITPRFGGYLTKPINISGETATIEGMDTLWDLQKQQIRKNFSIAGGTGTSSTDDLPYTDFPNVYEFIRYLGSVAEHPINCYTVPRDYAFILDFSSAADFNAVSVEGWEKEWDTKFGSPAPSLKLKMGKTPGDAHASLISAIPSLYDASIYQYISLSYYFSGATARNPLKFNIAITMYMDGETYANRETYILQFTGEGNQTNYLDSLSPLANGIIQESSFNLYELLKKKFSSSHYYITDIKFLGVISEDDVLNNRCSAVWINRITGYKEISHNPKYASQDVKTILEEIQQTCERTNHAAWVIPGETRIDDTLIVMPSLITTSIGVIKEIENLITCDGVSEDPISDGFVNRRDDSYNDGDSNTKYVQKIDFDSYYHFDRVDGHEMLDGVSNSTDAQVVSDNYVNSHCYIKQAFTVNVRGYPEILPEQYARCIIPKFHINGDFQAKTITREFDITKSPQLTSKVDFGRASLEFLLLFSKTRNTLSNLRARNMSNVYQTGSALSISRTSPGAFSN